MIIDCVADLHGFYPKLEGGDLLIVAGDLTARDIPNQYAEFVIWLQCQKYSKKIVIGGNHDNFLQEYKNWSDLCNLGFEYLCDSETEFEGLKIWGSPWTQTFEGMNPHCKAFTCDTDEELAEKWKLIPSDTDILITHSPPFEIFDLVLDYSGNCGCQKSVGSPSLRNTILSKERMPKLKLHCFGHIHEHGNKSMELTDCKFANCSYVNEYYKPVNKPIRIEL